MAARWQGVIALLLLIIISYVDRVNISVMILNPEFAAHFQLNENRMLQGMLMTCFLLGYGFSALLLTPVIESRWHYRQGLLSSIAIWALVCAISPLLGSLLGMLIARIVLGVAEGPLFSLKTRFINDNFAADEIGKPNALTALGVSLGLAVGFPLVTWLMVHVGWIGSFYALALLNLLLGGGLIWRFLPAPQVTSQRAKPGFRQTFALAPAYTAARLDPAGRNRHAQLSVGGVAPRLPAPAARRAPLLATDYRPAGGCPLSVKPRLKVSWRRAPRQNAPGAGAAAVYYRRPTHRRFCAGADAQPAAGDAGAVYAGGERFLGITGGSDPRGGSASRPARSGGQRLWDH